MYLNETFARLDLLISKKIATINDIYDKSLRSILENDEIAQNRLNEARQELLDVNNQLLNKNMEAVNLFSTRRSHGRDTRTDLNEIVRRTGTYNTAFVLFNPPPTENQLSLKTFLKTQFCFDDDCQQKQIRFNNFFLLPPSWFSKCIEGPVKKIDFKLDNKYFTTKSIVPLFLISYSTSDEKTSEHKIICKVDSIPNKIYMDDNWIVLVTSRGVDYEHYLNYEVYDYDLKLSCKFDASEYVYFNKHQVLYLVRFLHTGELHVLNLINKKLERIKVGSKLTDWIISTFEKPPTKNSVLGMYHQAATCRRKVSIDVGGPADLEKSLDTFVSTLYLSNVKLENVFSLFICRFLKRRFMGSFESSMCFGDIMFKIEDENKIDVLVFNCAFTATVPFEQRQVCDDTTSIVKTETLLPESRLERFIVYGDELNFNKNSLFFVHGLFSNINFEQNEYNIFKQRD